MYRLYTGIWGQQQFTGFQPQPQPPFVQHYHTHEFPTSPPTGYSFESSQDPPHHYLYTSPNSASSGTGASSEGYPRMTSPTRLLNFAPPWTASQETTGVPRLSRDLSTQLDLSQDVSTQQLLSNHTQMTSQNWMQAPPMPIAPDKFLEQRMRLHASTPVSVSQQAEMQLQVVPESAFSRLPQPTPPPPTHGGMKAYTLQK